MATIKTLKQLAKHLDVNPKAKNLEKAIAHRLFKNTECGIGFAADKNGVVLVGYCEGVDADCPAHKLSWSFADYEFDRYVELADKDGCEMWDRTHGCDDCNTEEICGFKAIDPNCGTCRGNGIII